MAKAHTVYIFDLNKKQLHELMSAQYAADFLGVNKAIISRVCKAAKEGIGKPVTSKNDGKKYLCSTEEDISLLEIKERGDWLKKVIYWFDKETLEYVGGGMTAEEAIKEYDINPQYLRVCLFNPGAFIVHKDALWSYDKNQKWEKREDRPLNWGTVCYQWKRFKNGKFKLVDSFNSCVDAEKETGISGQLIRKCINIPEVHKTAGGFYWTGSEEEPKAA